MNIEQQQKTLGYFIEEVTEHLDTIEQVFINLSSTIGNSENINKLFRATFSIKGGAAMLGLQSIQKTTHNLEAYFKIFRDYPIKADCQLELLLLKLCKSLKEVLASLETPLNWREDKATPLIAKLEPIFKDIDCHLNILLMEIKPEEPKTIMQLNDEELAELEALFNAN